MTKIIIKKEDEEVTYKSVTTTHTFKVNGKEVKVYCYDKQDMEQGDYDNDTSVDEDDLEALSTEEQEAFDEDLMSNLDLKVGGELEIDNE